jgi:hypothetical protein
VAHALVRAASRLSRRLAATQRAGAPARNSPRVTSGRWWASAVPLGENGYKVPLVRGILEETLLALAV